jgi:hypothetical protein
MPRIEYTTYQFTRPALPSEHSYGLLKKILLQNPGHSLNPKSSIRETFRFEIIFYPTVVGVGLIGTLLSEATSIEWIKTVGEIILGIAGIAGIIGFFHLLSFFLSFMSFLGFLLEKWSYYRSLKKDIIETSTYEDFVKRRKNK